METRDGPTLHSDAGPGGAAAPPGVPEGFAHLGRQPVLDRAGMLRGFELLFRGNVENRADIEDEDSATAQVIIRTIGEFGVRQEMCDA